jgi:hypothetical protein
VQELAVFAEKGRLRLEVPVDDKSHILYLSLEEAKQLQTQLSQSIIRIFHNRYAFNDTSLSISA